MDSIDLALLQLLRSNTKENFILFEYSCEANTGLSPNDFLKKHGFGDFGVETLTDYKRCRKAFLTNHNRTDLEPLRWMPNLVAVDCARSNVLDLSPLRECPMLQQLDCHHTEIADLQPLAGSRFLLRVNCSHTRVQDLRPLARCEKLQILDCSNTTVSDIRPLAACRQFQQLDCHRTAVTDLSALADCPTLERLDACETAVSDLQFLKKHPRRLWLYLGQTRVHDLSPLAECRLLRLDISDTPVRDIRPLYGQGDYFTLDCQNAPIPAEQLAEIKGINRKFDIYH